MSGIAHSVRRRLSIATTRTKTVEKNISTEYTSQKHALVRSKETLEKAIEEVKTKAHSKFASTYKEFSDLISGDVPADSILFNRTSEAKEAVNSINSKSKLPLENDSSAFRLIVHAEAYLNELKTIEKEFSSVEAAFVEVSRYEKKVGKLNDKSNKSTKDKSKGTDKIIDRARRNHDKLENERAAFQTKLSSCIDMMKKSQAKYEKILDCVFTAFWLSEHQFLTCTLEITKSIREQAQQVETELVNLDVSKM